MSPNVEDMIPLVVVVYNDQNLERMRNYLTALRFRDIQIVSESVK
jgi:hypothetical protein